jgi:ribonuclease HII
MLVAGIDEAGRGSVIGPLVIAGVLLNSEDLPKLVSLGVKDSKLLSPKKRSYLSQEIRSIATKLSIVSLSPKEIDRVVESGKKLHRLNRLEARTMAKVILDLNPDMTFVDASDVIAHRFKQHIEEEIPFDVNVISEHKADLKYPIVSASSIIAKVERDRLISIIKKRHGSIGSGYPSDTKTVEFLRNWIEKFESYPEFVRKSWKTAKRFKIKTRTLE